MDVSFFLCPALNSFNEGSRAQRLLEGKSGSELVSKPAMGQPLPMVSVRLLAGVDAAPVEVTLMLPSSARIGFGLPKMERSFFLCPILNSFIERSGAGKAATIC
jgi:hypothetical protein